MVVVKLNWLSKGETALKNERTQKSISQTFSDIKKQPFRT